MPELEIKSVPDGLSKPVKFAFVSGKGGVGKTMLAANFAWVCSHIARTLLVDLDFQNQGLKGLFAPHVRFARANALGAIQNPDDPVLRQPIEVSPGLGFLPSVSWEQRTSQDEITRCVHAEDFQKRLAAFLPKEFQEGAFEIVILDCHGGVDPVSLAAFQTCDHTLMVTEADSVTFNGTLELLDYYELKTRERQLKYNASQGSKSPSDRAAPQASRHIRFIINRLRSKYRWKDLDRIYRRFMKEGLGAFSQDRSIFCYIPVEESLADSFGEYPFHVKLAANSIFSKKVHFMAYTLTEGGLPLPANYKPLTKLRKPRYRNKVEKVVISNEYKNTQYILKFFAWVSILYAAALIAVAGALIHDAFKSSTHHPNAWQEVTEGLGYTSFLYVVLVAVVAPLLWYPIRALFGLMFLYRDKHRFQKALFRAVSPKLTLWQRLTLARLFILEVASSIIPLLLVVYAAVLVIFVLAAAFQKLFA